MSSRLDSFKRAIGLKARFRRSSEGAFTNVAFGTIVGMISGQYIFAEPLKEYFEQQQQQQQQQASASGSSGGTSVKK